jgi:homoserine kinase type II
MKLFVRPLSTGLWSPGCKSWVMDQVIINEALACFLVPSTNRVYSLRETHGGVNNIVSYVDIKDDLEERTLQSFILRIYNNGNDSNRVHFEHLILTELSKMKLSFQTPTPLLSLNQGKSHILLSTGAEGSMFKIIPGVLPKLSMTKEIGTACGELCETMSRIVLEKVEKNQCSTPPYYELYAVHHAIQNKRGIFFSRIEQPDFDDFRTEINEITKEITFLEELIASLLKLQLPIQLIHGDLHYDNILADLSNNLVTGILDFEFVAYDWKAMELAICLSKYAGEENPFIYFFPFIEGYLSKSSLTLEEMKVIPDLIILRILSNVVYFVGRLIAEEDEMITLTKRLRNYLYRIQWIKANRDRIVSKLSECSKPQSLQLRDS